MPLQELQKSLGQNGWAIFDFPNKVRMREDIEVLAALLGRPIAGRGTEAIEILQPTKKVAAHASSLSRQHGYGTFPLHCDTAHWLTPCHYILLGCVEPGIFSTPTLLLDFAEIELNRAEKASLRVETFLIKNGRRSFYGTIRGDHLFLRFDPGCMTPVSKTGYAAMDLLSYKRNKKSVREVHWHPGRGLLIDNWRILHGRAAVATAGQGRVLLRTMIQ
ncbi:MAG: TauD/TfdA family dioxygenase [Methylocella sp.]